MGDQKQILLQWPRAELSIDTYAQCRVIPRDKSAYSVVKSYALGPKELHSSRIAQQCWDFMY